MQSRVRTIGAVVLLGLSGCGTGPQSQDPASTCWESFERLRQERAPASEWLAWAQQLPAPQPQRDLKGWTKSIAKNYSLGDRRYLLLRFTGGPYWASAWTKAESKFKAHLPSGDYVWVEHDWAIARVEALENASLPEAADTWVIVVADGRIAVVSLRDRQALVVEHPRPHPVTPGPVEPCPLEFEEKPSIEEFIEMRGGTPVLRESR